MEKQEYERIKSLRRKVASNTATFAERNVLKIIDKKINSSIMRKRQ